MSSLVNNLKPPFYAAIIEDNKNPLSYDYEISPTDKLVSIAPHQLGFLGLETTKDKKENWVIISYWIDMDSEKAWEHIGDKQIQKHFDGVALKETCTISVLKINRKIGSSKKLYAGTRAWNIYKIIMSTSIGEFVISTFSVIQGMLNHKAIN